jgi:hypothetical protein
MGNISFYNDGNIVGIGVLAGDPGGTSPQSIDKIRLEVGAAFPESIGVNLFTASARAFVWDVSLEAVLPSNVEIISASTSAVADKQTSTFGVMTVSISPGNGIGQVADVSSIVFNAPYVPLSILTASPGGPGGTAGNGFRTGPTGKNMRHIIGGIFETATQPLYVIFYSSVTYRW